MILFAHRGAPATTAEENSLPAFRQALQMGANGLESDIGLTADGVPVLIHAGISTRGRMVARSRYEQIAASIPSLADLYRECGSSFHLSLDMAAPGAADAVVRLADESAARERLWLTYWRIPALAAWRERWPNVRLVHPAMPVRRKAATRLIENLAEVGVDALNVHWRFCRRGLVEAAHDRGLLMFAWGVKTPRALQKVTEHGVDGAYCDHGALAAPVPRR